MANSKSNIYPIQLQGAELCLNRYDAEIKQYSGFNKNNSPFVGGCLSNVFTKEEQIEGATDENTYIDEKGNVYVLKTDGFYKNNVKVLDIPETTNNFIACEQLPEDLTVVRYFTPNIKLRCVGNSWYLNDFYIADYIGFEPKDIAYRKANYCKYDDEDYYVIALNLLDKIFLAIVDYEGVIISHYLLNNGNTSDYLNYDFFVNVFSKNNKILVYVPNDISCDFYVFDVAADTFELSIEPENMYPHVTTIFIDDPNYEVISKSVMDWYFSEGVFYAIDIHEYRSHTESVAVKLSMTDIAFYRSGADLGLTAYTVDIYLGSNVQNWGLLNQFRDKFGFYSKFVAGYFQVYIGNDLYLVPHNASCIYNLTTIPWSGGTTLKVVENTVGKVINFAGDFKLLLNNNNLSGIGSNNNILLTDWNTVNANSLVELYNENGIYGICYEANNKFYVLKKTNKPVLKKMYNQLVFNVLNTVYNSFFLDRNKVGVFAPSMNLNIDIPNPAQKMRVNINTLSSSIYVAVAINEYNRKDNASLLLNPVLITPDFGTTITPAVNIPYDIYLYSEGNVGVPYYYATDYKGAYVINEKLVGLPFPVNTDGNIEYSPSLFSTIKNEYGNNAIIKINDTAYSLSKDNNEVVMSFFMMTGTENVDESFIIQGQYYAIIKEQIYGLYYNNGVVTGVSFIVNVNNLQFVGNTPYEALFFSKTNRCLYSFTGANVLNQKQLVDKISEVRNYLYNPATQTVFLITDIGVLFYGLFGMFLLEYTNITNIFLLDNGIVMSDNSGNYRYIKYYLDEGDTDYTKENIRLETCFYGMNNEVVTINDCLYFRLFSEEHEEGNLKVSATTISLKGRQTEETTFKIKASDWDKITHTIYLRYQPKTQRGLGVAFAIDSPFKIASMSVGSQPDAVLVDRVSKGAITAPSVTTNNNEW